MSERSSIQWTDATWNPVTGCDQISPGCAHCYAERFAERFRGVAGHPYERGFDLQLRPDRLEQPLRWRRPRMVFVCSMADLFHEQVPDEFIARVWAMMYQAPAHVFQVLTKRPERMSALVGTHDFIERVQRAGEALYDDPDDQYVQHGPWPPLNVWLGVSIESPRFAWRADILREIPAAVRFVSAEPLLAPLAGAAAGYERAGNQDGLRWERALRERGGIDLTGMDWLIVGGESGLGARSMDLVWARQLRDLCRESHTAVFVKQLGSVWAKERRQLGRPTDPKGGDPADWPEDLRVREFPSALEPIA